MTVYIDLFFIINLCADYIILSIPREKSSVLRKLLGASFGAVYSCFYFFKSAQFLFFLPIKLLVLFFMCTITVYPCSRKRLLNYYFYTLMSSCFVCGIIYCSKNFCKIPLNIPLSELFLAFGLSSGYIITIICSKHFKSKSVTNEHSITIYYNNKSVTAYGICDTGNSLFEPTNGYPVIICDISVLKHLISTHITPLNLCEFVQPEKFRVIPYNTVSSSGIMYGFIPDKIIINNTEITDVVIAPAQKNLGEDVLLNPLVI